VKRLWSLLSILLVTGCAYRERGRAAIIIPDRANVPHNAEALGRVTGRACFSSTSELSDDLVISAAVRAALRQAPGANALLDVELIDNGPCLLATGLALRFYFPTHQRR